MKFWIQRKKPQGLLPGASFLPRLGNLPPVDCLAMFVIQVVPPVDVGIMHMDDFVREYRVAREVVPEGTDFDCVHGDPLGCDCRLVFLQDAVFDVFTQLACDRVTDVPVIIALEERVEWVAHEQAVHSVHDPQATYLELVIEYHACQALYVAHARAFLEGPDLYACDRQAVEVALCFFHC